MGEGILNNTFSECPQVTNFAGSLCLKLNLEQQKTLIHLLGPN